MHIDTVRVGMVLQEPIISPFGDVLLEKGTILTARQVLFIKRLGITGVDVVDDPASSQSNLQLACALRNLSQLQEVPGNSDAVTQLYSDLKSVVMSLIEHNA